MQESDRGTQDARVAIVGAGPVGLAMALALARLGVRSMVLERNQTTSRTSKAPGLHVRTREIFRLWGVEDRALADGLLLQPVTMHRVEQGRGPLLTLDFSEIADEADRPGLLILEQSRTEEILLEAARASGLCEIRFGSDAVGLEQDASGVRVRCREAGVPRVHRADFLVGCDGAGSFVRDVLGLPFPGTTYALRPMLADVELDDARDRSDSPRAWTGAGGFAFAVRLRPGRWRIVHVPRGEPEKDDVPDEEVGELASLLLGPGPVRVGWTSRFRIHQRASPRFRVGRVFLAGDAAHVHSPASGFGMNGGIQDANNLAWKIAYTLAGGDAERLLDSYEEERRPVVVETTSRHTDRITRAFIASPPFVREAAWMATRLALRIRPIRMATLRRMTMTDLGYPASPLLGRLARARGERLPNPLLRAPDGSAVRLYELLSARPVLIDVAEDRPFSTDLPLPDTLRIGRDGFEDPSGRLREVLGRRDGWILVRPDGYIAWARRRRQGMERAIRRALGLATLPDIPQRPATVSPSSGNRGLP